MGWRGSSGFDIKRKEFKDWWLGAETPPPLPLPIKGDDLTKRNRLRVLGEGGGGLGRLGYDDKVEVWSE